MGKAVGGANTAQLCASDLASTLPCWPWLSRWVSGGLSGGKQFTARVVCDILRQTPISNQEERVMQKQERKLTHKEQERKKRLEQISQKMSADGYHKRDLTVGVIFANVVGPLMMLPFCVIVGVIYLCTKFSGDLLSFRIGWSFFPLLVVLIVLHEAIHGLTWGIFAKGHLRSISFGVIWSALTPYCTCGEPLKRWQYVLGGLMPTLILGFGMAAVSVALQSDLLFLLSEAMIVAGCGDFLIVWKLLTYNASGKDVMFYDHPYECGTVVFEREK